VPDALPTTVPATTAPALPAAVLWDMDGTLIDTEPFWMAAEIELAETHGAVWTHADALAMVGSAMSVCTAALRERGVDLPDEEIREFLNVRVAAGVARGIPWQKGAPEALGRLREAGVPLALVTSSFHRLADPFVEATGFFDVLVAGDDVERAKPDPEPYLTAARRLGVPITACVAVEDSRSGVASALASGARTVAIEVMAHVESRPGLSRISSLTDLGLDELARVAAGEVLDLRRAL